MHTKKLQNFSLQPLALSGVEGFLSGKLGGEKDKSVFQSF